MKKFRQVKNRRLVLGDVVFVYSIIAYDQVVKVRFYHQRKTPFLDIAFDYRSVWLVDPYRPKVLAELLLIHQALQRARPRAYRGLARRVGVVAAALGRLGTADTPGLGCGWCLRLASWRSVGRDPRDLALVVGPWVRCA